MMARRQRGFGLLDAMISLVILAVGLLAMTRLQGRTVQSATESQTRQKASQYADELVSAAILDNPLNRDCYTLPAAGTCPVPAAAAVATAWQTTTLAGMSSGATATAAFDTTNPNRLIVKITWTGKESSTTRTLEAITDVRVPPP